MITLADLSLGMSILAILIVIFGLIFPDRQSLLEFKCRIYGHHYIELIDKTCRFCDKCGTAEETK